MTLTGRGTEYSTQEAGASIALATSCDERHPPEGVLSPRPDDFWVTTGCFPQEIVIQLPYCIAARSVTVEMCDGAHTVRRSTLILQ
jgi:hypothetical protein